MPNIDPEGVSLDIANRYGYEDGEQYSLSANSKYITIFNKLKGDIEKLKKDIAEVREERFWFGDALMKVKDDIDKILYGDKDGCPYEYDTCLKPASVNLWNSWEVRIQSIEELKKEYDELSDNYENLINTNFQTESDEDINK